MTFAYDGGQRSHRVGAASRLDDGHRDWRPEDLAEHAKNTAGNVTRSAAEVTAACARVKAATEPTTQAAAKKEATLALESLRMAATAAASVLAQATDPEVAEVLKGARAQLTTAEAEVTALPEPAAASAPEVSGVSRFAAALPPADGPRPHDSPELVQRLMGIIDRELVHSDLDPLKTARQRWRVVAAAESPARKAAPPARRAPFGRAAPPHQILGSSLEIPPRRRRRKSGSVSSKDCSRTSRHQCALP